MEARLSIVFDKTKFNSKRFNIPVNESTNTFINKMVRKLKATDSNISFILVDFPEMNDSVFYFNKFSATSIWTNSLNLNQVQVSPNFLDLIEMNHINFNKFKEIDVLEKYPQLYKILPIKSEASIKNFVDFIINTLNINFHPDDDFMDNFPNNELIDVNGNRVQFDEVGIKFMNDQIENCLTVGGDYIYEIGTTILRDTLSPAVPENSNNDEDFSDDENDLDEYDIYGELIGRFLSIEHNGDDQRIIEVESIEYISSDEKDGTLYQLKWKPLENFIEKNAIEIEGIFLDELISDKKETYFETVFDEIIHLTDVTDNENFDGNSLIAHTPGYYQEAIEKEIGISLNDKTFTDDIIGRFTIRKDDLVNFHKKWIANLILEEDICQGYENYDIIFNNVENFVSSLFPTIRNSENFEPICNGLTSSIIEYQLKYQEKQPFVAPERLKYLFNGLTTYWRALSSAWRSNEDLLDLNYPFSYSFDELTIMDWMESVCGQMTFDMVDNSMKDNPYELTKAFGSYFEQIGEFVDNLQSSLSPGTFDNFNNLFTTDYPFKESFDDLVPLVRNWAFNIYLKKDDKPQINNDQQQLSEAIKRIVQTESYFDCDSDDETIADNNGLIFSTRANGDIGSESAGRTDIKEGHKLAELIKKSYPQVNVLVEPVDEWVILTVTLNK